MEHTLKRGLKEVYKRGTTVRGQNLEAKNAKERAKKHAQIKFHSLCSFLRALFFVSSDFKTIHIYLYQNE